MAYKNAWNCKRCPRTNTDIGCPAWTELLETNIATQEERITKDCLFILLPRLMVEVIKVSNRPAAEISAMRCEVGKGFVQIASVLRELPMLEKLNG